MGVWWRDRVSNTRANATSDTRPMPNTRKHDWGYAEAALPQDIYKGFSTCMVLCLVVHRAVDNVVYVCVHTLFVLLIE